MHGNGFGFFLESFEPFVGGGTSRLAVLSAFMNVCRRETILRNSNHNVAVRFEERDFINSDIRPFTPLQTLFLQTSSVDNFSWHI